MEINWTEFFDNTINEEAIEKQIQDAKDGNPEAIALIEALKNLK
jgi:hypothetical protein